MKQYTFSHSLLVFILLLSARAMQAQFAWIEPAIPDVTKSVTIFIDLSQDPGCQNLVGRNNPLYLWSWVPSNPVVGNGDWGNSNNDLQLTKVSETVYSFTMVPTEFYGLDAFDIYDQGIKCLAKEDDGGGGGDCAVGGGEYKTSDITIPVPAPFSLEKLVSAFPTTIGAKADDTAGDTVLTSRDDVFTLIYNNKVEEKPTMLGIAADSCAVYARIIGSNGQSYTISPLSQIEANPALRMATSGDGKFYLSLVPSDFYKDVLPEGVRPQTMRFQIVRLPFCGGNCATDKEYRFNFKCE
jgi:hypothetical protein